MKMMNKVCALVLSVALCAGMAAPAFAYDGEPVEEVEQPVLTAATEEEEAVTVTDEEIGALTPEGNLTLVDDYHTDYSDGSGQQFITLVSKSGNTFYLVIDRKHLQQNWKFRRGDIYYVQFGNTSTGSEQHGDRPAVIIQNDVGNTYAPTLIVVPLTSNTEKKVNQPTHCLLENEGLSMSSMALAEQIFTIDKSRILKYLGHLAPEDMQRLDYALKNSLALNPLGSIRKLKPIIRSTAAYAPPEVVDGKPPVYPYTPIQSSFEDAGSVEEMMLYTELQSAVHAMIQRLEYSFTFNPSLLTIPKRKQQVSEILAEAEKYIWRIREEMQCE